MKEKRYTIQEIRDMLVRMEYDMNPYKLIDAANGISVVQQFLMYIQDRDSKNKD